MSLLPEPTDYLRLQDDPVNPRAFKSVTVAELALSVSEADYDSRYVRKDDSAEQVISGPISLPLNGLRVGTNQLVTSGGKVGINRNPTTYSLEVQGDIYTTGNFRGDGSQLTNLPNPLPSGGTVNHYLRGDVSWQTLDKNSVGLGNVLNVAQEPAVAPGTSLQYLRGDKSWQTLNTAAVPESGNQYFTNTRADSRIAAAIGVSIQAFDATLTALAAFNSNGILVQTAVDTFTARSLSQPVAGLTIANSNGVTGNPTFALANDLAALEGLGATGFAVRTAADTWTQRSIDFTAGTGISVTNANGVAGNPTFAGIDASTTVKGVASFNATNFSATAGAINTIQNINTSATPTFGGLVSNGTTFGLVNTVASTINFGGAATTLNMGALAGTVNFAGTLLNPGTGYNTDIGQLTKKFKALHAAELWVETLVAQNTLATIGGRILVGPTTSLIADLGSAATTMNVKHNSLVSGDRVYLEANGQVEFIGVTSGPTASGGGYNYTIIRNLDSTGANDWTAGDAVFSTGTTGSGWIDLYSIRGMKSSAQSGPTIVGNVRNSAAYNDWSEHWAIGNLKGLYGYGATTFGAAFGPYTAGTSHLTVDATNGIRIFKDTATVIGQWSIGGVITVGEIAAGKSNILISAGVLELRNDGTVRAQIAADGSAYFGNNNLVISSAGVLTIGSWTINSTSISSGGLTLAASATAIDNKIYVGTGTYGNANTAFYVDGVGKLSLKDKLTWDGTTLTVNGGGTFSGALSAATGTFAGVLSGATGTFSGALSAATGSFSGTVTGGGGNVVLGTNGLAVVSGGSWEQARSYSNVNAVGGNVVSSFYSTITAGSTQTTIENKLLSGRSSALDIISQSASGEASTLNLWVKEGSNHGSQITMAIGALHFSTSGNSWISIDSVGNVAFDTNTFYVGASNNRVGIGTTSPGSTLDVQGRIYTNTGVGIGMTDLSNGLLSIRASAGTLASITRWEQLQTGGGGANDRGFYIAFGGGSTGGTSRAFFGVTHTGTGSDTFWVGETTNALAFSSMGAIQMGTSTDGTNGIVRLTISTAGMMRWHAYGAGTLTADASGNITTTSDERQKDIKGTFDLGLSSLLKIEPIIYRWKKESGGDTLNDYAGFSAQNIADAIPLAIGRNANRMMTLQDRAIMGVVVNSVKELDNSIQELQARITRLEKQISDIGIQPST